MTCSAIISHFEPETLFELYALIRRNSLLSNDTSNLFVLKIVKVHYVTFRQLGIYFGNLKTTPQNKSLFCSKKCKYGFEVHLTTISYIKSSVFLFVYRTVVHLLKAKYTTLCTDCHRVMIFRKRPLTLEQPMGRIYPWLFFDCM